MSEATKVFGKGGTVEHQGRRYHYGPLTLDALAAFSAWLEDRAWRRVEIQRGRLAEADYQGRLDAVARLIAQNAFDSDGPIAAQAAQTAEGARQLFYLMLRSVPNEEDVSEEVAAEIYDTNTQAVAARMASANADPTPGPAAAVS